MPTLLFENGPDRGSGVELEPDRSYLLGRDPRCDIVIRDDLVSRHHARMKEYKGAWYIKDQSSTNGILVNDRRTKQAAISFGDQLRIGNAVLTLVEESLEEVRSEKTLGGYRLRERLGRGGMGTVYKALQVSLGREVALKVLSPHLVQDKTFIQQFQREARAAGQLNHPNIVQVYDVGQDGDTYYYSMEFIEGGSLEDRLRQEGTIGVEETIEILQQAARALEYAETRHIVHRDIKPDNLMLTADGELRIADLGLALSMKDHGGSSGQPILGTPHFIAPEQALRQDVDIRTDIYSLGATAYRMLTGRTVFEGQSAEEIIRKAVREEPTPLRELEASVPEKLSVIIHRMLEKDPDDRPASARELRESLETLTRSRSKTILLASLSGLAACALTVALYLWIRGPETETVIQVQEDETSARKAFEAMSALDQRVVEVSALRAYIDILQDADAPAERLAALSAWIDEYGHLTIDEADLIGDEAARLSASIETERLAAEREREQTGRRLADVQQRSEAARAEERYLDAVAVAAELSDDGDAQKDESALRRRLIDEALQAARTRFDTSRAETTPDDGDIERALVACQTWAGLFPEPPSTLPDAAREELDRFHQFFQTRKVELDEARATAALTREMDHHQLVVDAFGASFQQALLRLDFAGAKAELEHALERVSLEEYRPLLGEPLSHLEGILAIEARLVALLDDASTQPTFTVDGESAKLERLDRSSNAIKVRISHGGLGSSSKEIPLATLATPEGIRALFARTQTLSAEDAAHVVMTMALVQSARLAQLAPAVATSSAQYDPDVGWDASRKIPWSEPEGASLATMADALLNGVQGDPAEAITLRVRAEVEAHATLVLGLAPFVDGPVKAGWTDAAASLESLFTTHRDSLIVRMVYPHLHHGAQYPLVDS